MWPPSAATATSAHQFAGPAARLRRLEAREIRRGVRELVIALETLNS
jgi:hypothetical protein